MGWGEGERPPSPLTIRWHEPIGRADLQPEQSVGGDLQQSKFKETRSGRLRPLPTREEFDRREVPRWMARVIGCTEGTPQRPSACKKPSSAKIRQPWL